MNKLFQLTLLTAALSTSSGHAVIRKVTQIFKRLVPLYTPTRPQITPFPPSRCFKKKNPTTFVAEVVTRHWYTFDNVSEVQIIVRNAQESHATEINWFEKE